MHLHAFILIATVHDFVGMINMNFLVLFIFEKKTLSNEYKKKETIMLDEPPYKGKKILLY